MSETPGPDENTIGHQVARSVGRVRRERRLPYTELAARLVDLGCPIPVLGLRRIEKAERRVDVDELIALARALEVHPIELVFPLGYTEIVELLPGDPVPTWSAVKWFTGEGRYPRVPIPDLTVRTYDDRPESAVALHRLHDQRLAEWARHQDRATVARLGLGNAISEETEIRKQIIAVAEEAARSEENVIYGIRQRMRQHGYIPPPIYDARLAHIDGGDK